MRFDDAISRGDRWRNDRFAAFRDVFEKFFHNCSKVMDPDDYLGVNEILYPTKGKLEASHFDRYAVIPPLLVIVQVNL